MDYLCLFLWIFMNKFLSISSSSCVQYEKCLDDLRKFSQVDEFHIYTSLEETEIACSEAKDAYLCVLSEPECKDRSRKVQLSPIIKGSSRLLKAFCGFQAKRRPCCSLRNHYLEHSSCYEKISKTLDDCNDKYRISLDKIMTVSEKIEQEKQRFCSVEWFENCVQSVTQSTCGKAAAQVIKSFASKAGKPEKRYLTKNENCSEIPYGIQDERDFCEKDQFYKCPIQLLSLQKNLADDKRTEEETVLSLCTGIHDSLDCLNQAFKRCIFSHKAKKLQDANENEICVTKEDVLQKYRGKVNCLASQIQELSQCQLDFDARSEYITSINRFVRYKEYFCGVLHSLETCWISKASSFCGEEGKEMMSHIVDRATVNIHRNCKL